MSHRYFTELKKSILMSGSLFELDKYFVLLDAEHNGGIGVHNASSTYWKDLINGSNLTLSASAVNFGANYYDNSQTANITKAITTESGNILSFDVVFEPKAITNTASIPFRTAAVNVTNGFTIILRPATTCDFRFNYNSINYDAYKPNTANLFPTNKIYHLAVTIDITNLEMKVYIDGSLFQTVALTAGTQLLWSTIAFGWGGAGTNRANCKYYTMGYTYSEIWTPEFIARAAAKADERFGL